MPTFFATPEAFREWFGQHGDSARELIVGFYKRGSGRPSITWPEAVDEALCAGWIDGVRRNIDGESYQIRFTPRKAVSTWSAVNIRRVEVLSGEGRMKPTGLAAFARRTEAKSRTYAYEQKTAAALNPADEAYFRRQTQAWSYFQEQPPGYRHKVIWLITSAKQEEARRKRLLQLVEACTKGERL